MYWIPYLEQALHQLDQVLHEPFDRLVNPRHRQIPLLPQCEAQREADESRGQLVLLQGLVPLQQHPVLLRQAA